MWVKIWRRQLTPGQERLRDAMAFALRLAALAAPLYLLMAVADLMFLQLAVADHAFWVLQAAGLEPVREGVGMQVGDFSFFISRDSTGWKAMVFLAALVVAVPGAGWKRRATGVAVGIPVIYAGNLARVVAIVEIQGAYGTTAALLAHDYLWGLGMVGLVLGIWLLWMRWVRRRHGR